MSLPKARTEDELVALRRWAVEQAALAMSAGGGKPNHTAYLASDILDFVLTGKKPTGPVKAGDILESRPPF